MSLTQDITAQIQKALENTNIKKSDAPKVSIIIPVYNAEKFLSKCLFSVINQTEKDIEIIVINDGSTDDSQKILSLFSEKDKRITIIEQEHNLQGAARNSGIKHARGEYIGFVDADDWVDKDYFEKLYIAAKKYNSDLALAINTRVGNGKTKNRLNITEETFKTNLQDKIDTCLLWKDACPTNKIYKKEFLIKYDILYPEGVYCEDKLFSVKSVYYANGIVTVPNVHYYYFRNPNSTVKRYSKTKTHKNDKEKARLNVLNFLRSSKAEIRDGDFSAVTKSLKIFGITLYTKKESLHSAKHYLFNCIKIKNEKLTQ